MYGFLYVSVSYLAPEVVGIVVILRTTLYIVVEINNNNLILYYLENRKL